MVQMYIITATPVYVMKNYWFNFMIAWKQSDLKLYHVFYMSLLIITTLIFSVMFIKQEDPK